jgi:hypothetical protein
MRDKRLSDRLDLPNRLLEHAFYLVAAKLQSGNHLFFS